MEKSIFEKIADKTIPAYIVWEDGEYMAFLDINPLSEGHTLVVPKRNPGDYIFDLNEDNYLGLWIAVDKVAKLLKKCLNKDRVLVWVEGFEVPHVHVHLIPVVQDQGLSKLKPTKPAEGELQSILAKIKSA